ncbi:MAG: Hsp33 family molecular chaperone HslO [Micavibrio aeruginosavorus]|uniref:Hsp33 family molecular chaperone HslO n=1 Tax=Micavibrio aeruginosavorus TaxID=349221 RepID=A0A7T5UHL0_9BACT|nr:MAG: Hsp33 family molecular chaperone HslO [Micavibrio aeruginosavorus]
MTDTILPFIIESSGLRGRLVRLDSVLDKILEAHGYIEPVARLTAELATMAVMLGSMLKYEGIFTLQVQTEGAIKILVSDFTSAGDLRACATLDKDFMTEDQGASLLGKGYVAFTVDQGENTERYQGIVELSPGGLLESIQTYFTQSEQIRTGVRMAVSRIDGRWRGAAIMLQDMPEEGGILPSEGVIVSAAEDDWRRAMILLQSCTDEELLSASIDGEDVLFRLFHEDGVRVFDKKPAQKGCRCTMEKIGGILSTMPPDDIAHMAENGRITVTCEFCNHDFSFDPEAFRRNIKP